MIMRHLCFFALMCYAGPSLHSQNNPFILSGNISAHPDWHTRAYLIRADDYGTIFSGSDLFVVDSFDISKGAFRYSIPVPAGKPVIYRINTIMRGQPGKAGMHMGVPFENYLHFVATPGGRLELNARAEQLTQSYQITSGSAENLSIQHLRDCHLPFLNAAGPVMEKMQKAAQTPGTDLQKVREEAMQTMFTHALAEQQQAKTFLDTTRQGYAATIAIHTYNFDENKTRNYPVIKKWIEGWKKQGIQNQYLQELLQEIDDFENFLPIGSKAPDIMLTNAQGNPVRLYDIDAPLIIIDFWASWCGPCRQENKEVVKPVYETYHAKGLEIFGVSFDTDPAKWKRALEKDGYAWANGIDNQGIADSDIAKMYKIKGLPTSYLLDRNKTIINKNLRGEALRTFISSYFEK
jgi:thiol-disulfide isomerase/thioredoxin